VDHLFDSDGGTRWVSHRLPASRGICAAISVVSASTWVVADRHDLYLKTNGGVGWSHQTSSVNLRGPVLDFVNTLDGWDVLASGICHTTDGDRQSELELPPGSVGR
jgi:photosystem II stability/assembly factor-like uncharacterized protein